MPHVVSGDEENRTRLPKTSQLLEPAWPPSVPFTQRDQDNRRRQASDFNRRHADRTLRPLQAGERVWVQDVNSPAIILGPAQRPRSYVVETPTGVLQRNRKHLVPTTGQPGGKHGQSTCNSRSGPDRDYYTVTTCGRTEPT
ncbi:hypothetical protein MTO96_044509 [Rhipicephalus appendiculatus]